MNNQRIANELQRAVLDSVNANFRDAIFGVVGSDKPIMEMANNYLPIFKPSVVCKFR
jgi:hypothetical protein